MGTLWEQNGLLICDDPGAELVECDTCPCQGCGTCDPGTTPAAVIVEMHNVGQQDCEDFDWCAEFWNNTAVEVPQYTGEPPNPCSYLITDIVTAPCGGLSSFGVWQISFQIQATEYVMLLDHSATHDSVKLTKPRTSDDCGADLKGEYTTRSEVNNVSCNWDAATCTVS